MSQSPSEMHTLVEPLLSLRQLDARDIRYVIGSDLTAGYLSSLLPARLKNRITFVGRSDEPTFEGRPAISMRRFLSETPPSEPIIYAMDDPSWLPLLIACNQRRIITTSEFSRSHYRSLTQPRSSSPAWAVVSTIPRSGTHRIRYFLYALNELLRNPSRIPSPHKLYLYYRHQGSATDSKYHPAEALQFLGVDSCDVGHFNPPGSLATLDHSSIITRIYTPRLTSCITACALNPALTRESHSEVCFEPILPFGTSHRVRYSLIVRDVLDQICSILTALEVMCLSARTERQPPLSLESYVDYFCRELIPPPFCRFDGQMSLILWKAVSQGRRATDVVFEDGHIDSLIRDYAWQLAAARYYERTGSSGLSARIFNYSDMISDEPRFFQDLVSFIRGAELSPDQRKLVDQARHVTRAAAGIEETLGHSLSYDELERTPFRGKSHQIDNLSEGRQTRSEVRSLIQARGETIRKTLSDLLQQLLGSDTAPGAA